MLFDAAGGKTDQTATSFNAGQITTEFGTKKQPMIDGLKARHRTAIIDILAANERVELVVLFGSRAMQTHTPTSDIDIALFGDNLTLTDQANLAAAIDDLPMAQRADLVLYKTIDNSALREHIERHGVEWYRKPQSTTNTDLYLAPKHRRLLEDLVREHLPGDEVRAYGSRVSGSGHDDGDLDLVLREPGLNETPIDSLVEFENAVREANIPFQVEVRDWARLPESIHRKVERDYVVIVKGAGGSTRPRSPMPQSPPGCESLGKNKFTEMPITKAVEINPTIKLSRSHNYAFVAMADLTGGVTRVCSSNTKEFKGSGAKFQHGDTLFARITPCLENGKIAKYLEAVGEVGFGSTEFIVFRGRDGITTTDYSHYLATDPKFRSFAISKMTGTSGRQRVPVDALESYVVQVPSIQQQRAITHILGMLDDKIEVNHRMNATLEAMARSIFKDWFVDFGPTRAKAEGHEPYLAPQVWGLFPDKLDDEDKPEGWAHRIVYDFANVVYGAPFASKQFNTDGVGMPLIRIRDLVTQKPGVFTEEVHPKGHLIQPGDIVVGMDGEFRLHIWKGPSAWLNQRVCHFEPLNQALAAFLVEALKSPLEFFERGKVGTTVIHLGKSDIDTFRLLHPGDELLTAFSYVAEPLVEATVRNALESRTLAQIRDLLLPKLISGEICLRDTEKIGGKLG